MFQFLAMARAFNVSFIPGELRMKAFDGGEEAEILVRF